MAYIYDLTDTWNAGGTTFSAIKMNVTDSASAAASKLVTLQTNGTEHFSVTKAGVGYFSGNVGIGTSSPGAKLHVDNGTSACQLRIRGGFAGSTSPELQFYAASSDHNWTIRGNHSQALQFGKGVFGDFGTELMRLDINGNVGIGTSSVAGRLHSVSTSGFVAPTLLCGDGVGTFRVVFNTGAYAGVPANKPWLHSYDDIYIGSDAGTSFNVMSGGVNTLKVTSSGNVGIGTTGPVEKLSVVGNIELAVGANRYVKIGSSTNYNYTLSAVGDDFQILEAGTTPRLTIKYPNGNVGIGTSSPAVKLEVASTDAITSLRVDTENAGVSANNYSEVALADNNTVRTWWRNVRDGTGKTAFGYNNHLAFLSDAGGTPTERMRIDSSGNLLVGTTSGSQRLVVRGASSNAAANFIADNSGGAGAYFQNVSGTANYFAAQFLTNGGGSAVGSIEVSSTATAYNTSSDYRLKDIDGPITNSGAYIDALKPVQGRWKADGSRFIGLLAHEVQEVSETPIATGIKDGEEMQAMDYSAPELIANLIAEIQSLRARVAQLEGN